VNGTRERRACNIMYREGGRNAGEHRERVNKRRSRKGGTRADPSAGGRPSWSKGYRACDYGVSKDEGNGREKQKMDSEEKEGRQ